MLLDRYNPEYEHYFPDVERRQDVYRLRVNEDRTVCYVYERTKSVTVKDYE